MKRVALFLGSAALVMAPFLRHPGDGVVLGAALGVALAHLLVA